MGLAPVPNTQVRRDPAYPLLYGRLYDRFKKDYAVVEDLPSVQAHPDASPYIVRHRMRKAAEKWPLVQVGPGVITVNEGKDYSWDESAKRSCAFSRPLPIFIRSARFL